ncbi:MAG: hypothetical protein IJ227_01995 [Mogibacterium sp.]|nr:hypothetical protein [Mogibacterium sp.]
MSTLDSIKEVLNGIAASGDYPFSGGVFYGICSARTLPEWNYFVFNRKETAPTNQKSRTEYFEIHIVHEDYILEDFEYTVEQAIKDAIPGTSLSQETSYEYVIKNDTQMVVEICTLTFKHVRKVGDL